ncbi:MAG: UPF0182 family protein [Chloroflexota bacterium]
MPEGRAIKRQLMLMAVVGGLFLAVEVASGAIGLYTDWLWFGSLGYQSVFITVLQSKVLAFAVGAIAFMLLALPSLLLTKTAESKTRSSVSIREQDGVAYIVQQDQGTSRRWILRAAILIAIGLSVVMGFSAAGQWETALKFLNSTTFGVADPLFNQDVGFYFFTLPFYRFLQGWLFSALILVLLLTVAVYVVSISEERINLDLEVFNNHRSAKLHVMLLAALIALAMAASYRIQIFDLVYSTRSVTFGAGFTDATARQMSLWAMLGIMGITAALFVVSAFRRGFTLPLYGLGLWVAAALLLGGAYPAIVQKLQVEPSELEKERPYIEAGINMTRQAFGLDRIEEQDFMAEDAVTPEWILDSPDTINNIRLWDHRPLMETYNQIQAIRLYYDFNDVDIDRYTIDGRYRQVMLSARELSPEKLADQAQTWVTRRLQFTHGYGLAMSPVTEVVGEGLPHLVVKDLPPQGAIEVAKPQIYYGEKTSGYVIVNTTAQEFDYAKGDENVYGTYQGGGGVRLDSFINKLAYALYFRDGNILFTGYLTPDSQVLYHREIQQRVQKIAPFLMLDQDPYLVVADGELYWIQDAYTYSMSYPYSSPYQEFIQTTVQSQQGLATQQVRTGREFNYIRNSVKVVISAYDGSARFYLAEPDDPLAVTYKKIFPDLFTAMDEMPDSLRAHVRYPEDLFKAQAEKYRLFHMQDPQVFYNQEDLWSVPTEVFADNRQAVEPYYLIMRLPGESGEEFLQLLPFSPSNKDNMIAWLAARSDGDNYGKLIVYKYPKDKLIYGPMQVEARINQDPTISSQFTLWSRQGSKVIRGNLLAIPVGQANLYVEPVYLQADSGSIPELKRVIVSTGNRVVMEPTLQEALANLYDGKLDLAGIAPAAQAQGQPDTGAQASTPEAEPGTVPSIPTLSDLAKSAQDHYNRAMELLRTGDWAGFGEELKKLEQDLNNLNTQTQAQ